MTHRVAVIAPNPGLPFLFEAAARAGCLLTLAALPGVDVSGLPNVEDTVTLDIFGDPDGAHTWLKGRHASQPFDAVITLYEAAAPFTAEAAQRLGLRGISPEVARICRDKYRQRGAMRQAGLDVPGYRLVDPAAELAEQVAGLRFPLVVKPVNGLASQGVSRADDLAGLRDSVGLVLNINAERLASYADASFAEQTGVLAEEFIDGPEYCVEAVSDLAGTRVLAITDKGNLQGPFFEERTFITPAPLDPGTAARIAAAVCAAHRQIGVDFGASHSELRLRADGSPVLLEIAARMGGAGTVHYLVETATGIDFLGAVLEQAIDGALPDVSPTRQRFAADWIVPVTEHGTYAGLAGAAEVRGHPATDLLLELMTPGTEVPAWPRFVGYPAFVLSSHPSYRDCLDFHTWLADTIRVRWA
jgi:biotin carboxylase